MFQIIQVFKEVEQMQSDVITSEQVMNKLRNVKLEDYSKDDLLERYIVYGSESELQEPPIQKALINNDLHIELLDMVNIITDAGAIQDLLKSDLFNNKSIHTMEGNISDIQYYCESNTKKDMICHTIVKFEDVNGNNYQMYGHTFNNIEDLQSHKTALEPYYNNIVLVVEKSENQLYVVGFLKKYEDIDYSGGDEK